MNPRHVNPTEPGRTARAPYNFVPLPEKVFTVEDGIDVAGEKIKPWEHHDEYVPNTSSGWIDLDITTLTPLYIRGPATRDHQGRWDPRDARLRPAPCSAAYGRPAIPGSSLRGMIRTLVEILAFAKIQPVSRARPFFRTVSDDRLGKAYRSRMIRGTRKPPGGLLRIQPDRIRVEPCEVLRVDRRMLGHLSARGGPGYTPPWTHQQHPCWVKAAHEAGIVDRIEVQKDRPPGEGWQRGTLVLSGNAPRKKREFVFLEPRPQGALVTVPDWVWDRFHDDDQITQWQEKAFPRDRPVRGSRKRAGHLRDGEPVFFLSDPDVRNEDNPDGLVFLGRAQMFRFPYDLSPGDLVPEAIRNAPLDLAEAMFGRVGRVAGVAGKAIKGRVFVEDAMAVGPPPEDGRLESVMVPGILSAPKPTTFQHYLTQDGTASQQQLTTYLDGDHTTIRGHKLYWHRWGEQGLEAVREPVEHQQKLQDLGEGRGDKHSQHTIIQPVKTSVTFQGRVRFENLTDIELGALLSALALPGGCAHRLGMGKPLGLGSVSITTGIRLVDRTRRYARWEDDGVTKDDGGRFRAAFEAAMLAHARRAGETLLPHVQGLRGIARLDALFRLLEWDRRPAPGDTRYMMIEDGDRARYGDANEFRRRPVLPSPHGVVGDAEPPWPQYRPRPATDRGGARTSPTSQRPEPSHTPRRPKAGDQVDATLLAERSSKGGWRARHDATGLVGPINNSGDVPEDRQPGETLTLVVASVNDQGIAFRYTHAEAGMPARQQKGTSRKPRVGQQQHGQRSSG